MQFETIIVETKDHIGKVIVNRPNKLNAMNSKVREELNAAFKMLNEDKDVYVIIITGAGNKAFIAGADINEFKGASASEMYTNFRPETIFYELHRTQKPIIAMINGYALGGGLELAMACDIRIASKSAKLGQPEIKLGLIPGWGGTQRLPRLIGEGRAMWMILTGEMIDAEKAYQWGLIDFLVEPEELETFTMGIAKKITEMSPLTIRVAKEAVKAASQMSLKDGLELESRLFALLFSTKDKEEGVNAFLEKRKPQFIGE